jgi:hypothetical protein
MPSAAWCVTIICLSFFALYERENDKRKRGSTALPKTKKRQLRKSYILGQKQDRISASLRVAYKIEHMYASYYTIDHASQQAKLEVFRRPLTTYPYDPCK